MQGGDAADRRPQVAAAGPDGVADAFACPIQQTRNFLQTRARGADQPDPPAPDHVGKPETDAVEDGRAAIRAHHQQAALAGALLQIDLVFQRHVV